MSLHTFGFLRLCCQVESNKLEACVAWICNGVEVDAENEQKHTQFKEALQKIEVQEASDLQLKSVDVIEYRIYLIYNKHIVMIYSKFLLTNEKELDGSMMKMKKIRRRWRIMVIVSDSSDPVGNAIMQVSWRLTFQVECCL